MLCSEVDQPASVSDCHSVEVSSRDSGWNLRNHLRGGIPENTVFSEPLMLLRSLFEHLAQESSYWFRTATLMLPEMGNLQKQRQ